MPFGQVNINIPVSIANGGTESTTAEAAFNALNIAGNMQLGLYNIAFQQGTDSSILKITSTTGAALSSTNRGYVRIRSSSAGTWRTFTVSADVTIDLTGAHWGLDAKGNTTSSILRVYAIDDNGSLVWGVGYQGGFSYIRNTQDDTTQSNINLPEEILTNASVATDNSPMRDVGYILADFTDSTNEWAITGYFPGESADGIWQQWTTTYTGFSSAQSGGTIKWMQQGTTIFCQHLRNSGTSNATTFTMTLPIKTRQVTDNVSRIADNGSGSTAPGLLESGASNTTLILYKDLTGAVWTNTGAKSAIFVFIYEGYQP